MLQNDTAQTITLADEVLTLKQVSELLGCEPATATLLIKNGVLPGLKFGHSWIIPRRALIDRLNELAAQDALERREARNKPSHPIDLLAAFQPAKRGPKRSVRPQLPQLPPAPTRGDFQDPKKYEEACRLRDMQVNEICLEFSLRGGGQFIK